MSVSIDENALKVIDALQRPGNPDLLVRIVARFKTESPILLKSMLDSVESMDMEAVRVAAHTLKSSSAYVGAHQLSGRCKELERAAHDQNFPACIALSDSVEDIFMDSCAALDQLMSKAA